MDAGTPNCRSRCGKHAPDVHGIDPPYGPSVVHAMEESYADSVSTLLWHGCAYENGGCLSHDFGSEGRVHKETRTFGTTTPEIGYRLSLEQKTGIADFILL